MVYTGNPRILAPRDGVLPAHNLVEQPDRPEHVSRGNVPRHREGLRGCHARAAPARPEL